jgi:hypothetical protein
LNLQQFAIACDFASLREVDKVCHLAFFYFKTRNTQDFSASDAANWLFDYGLPRPNPSRLNGNLKQNKSLVRVQHGFRLHVDFLRGMETKFPEVGEKSQQVLEYGTILPEPDYVKTRGYIEALAKQINAAYEHNLFDACAVLMRRLVEILLILSYRHLGIENQIKDTNGLFFMLESIIGNAKNNSVLDLSRNSRSSLDVFRELGNFSAHKIEYICRREYIKPHIQEYRALIVELLHKGGLRT